MEEQHKSMKVKLSEIAKNALTHIFIINNNNRAVTISSMVSTNDAIYTYHACIEIIHILGLLKITPKLLKMRKL